MISDDFSIFRPLEQRARDALEKDERTIFVPLRDLFQLLQSLEYAHVVAAEQHMAVQVARQRDAETEARRADHLGQLDALTGVIERLYYDHKRQKNGRVSVDESDFKQLIRAWGGPTETRDKAAYLNEAEAWA